jgi:hypothetical protein
MRTEPYTRVVSFAATVVVLFGGAVSACSEDSGSSVWRPNSADGGSTGGSGQGGTTGQGGAGQGGNSVGGAGQGGSAQGGGGQGGSTGPTRVCV